MEIEVRRDFLGVQAAAQRDLPIVADYVQFLQLYQPQLYEMLHFREVHALEVMLIYFGCGLEDGEIEVGARLPDFDLVEEDHNFAQIQLVFVVVADELLVNLP